MLNGSPLPSWIVFKGRIVFANPALLKMLGAEREDQVVGHSPFDFIHTDCQERARARMEAVLEAGLADTATDERIQTLTGAIVEIEVTRARLPYQDGSAIQATFVDIRERRRLERAQKDADRNLRLIAENATEVILAYDMDRNLLYGNPALEQLTGYSLTELYSQKFIKWVHPEDEKRILDLWNGVFRGESYYEQPYRVVTKQGHVRWSSSTWAPMYDESGVQIGIQGRERDITAEKVAEEAKRLSEDRFWAAFAYAAVGEALLDTEGHFIETNRAFCEITGYSKFEISNLNVGAITHPDDLEWWEQLTARMIAGIVPGFVTEKRYVRKDGSPVWVKNSVSLVRKPDGTPLNMIVLSENIAERKMAEEALAKSEDQFRRVFENSPLGMMILGPDRRFIRTNHAFLEMIEYSPEELATMGIADLTHPDDLQDNLTGVDAVKRGAAPFYRTEKRYISKSGKTVYAEVFVTLLGRLPPKCWPSCTTSRSANRRRKRCGDPKSSYGKCRKWRRSVYWREESRMISIICLP